MWDFSDDLNAPSLDGWSIISQGVGRPKIQAERSEANRLGPAPVLTTAFDIPAGGFVGDDGHVPLIARSPEFMITIAGDITFDSVGGHTNAIAPGLGAGAYASGAMGISLVRALDGVRVLSVETSQFGTATGYSFDITPYVNDGNKYYLEAVDNFGGGWGYVEWDNFKIPIAPATATPEPATSLLALLGLSGLARRRRRAQV